ncbi:MAG TPA: DUF364 domain-containing protein [Desulfosalsimonadaceae bacterium]|nr:DUF364 domain-containing protein [Desulfosalsimonadaceae bacterium]
MAAIFEELKTRIRPILDANQLLEQKVRIRARALSTEEAIGNPEANDFPLQKGRERLMQAEFNGALGQAYTDRFGDYEGTMSEILDMPLANNFRRAIFVAAVNAALRYLGKVDGTIHCRDTGPALCGKQLAPFIKERYGQPKVALIGFQPRMAENLAAPFALRIVDMDPENIGTRPNSTEIESPDRTEAVIDWADLLCVTGTTLVNDTIEQFLVAKPTIFYGTTIAGAASLMDWQRFCAESE